MNQESVQNEQKTPLSHMFGYSTGSGVQSLTMNGISAFAMTFYTQALGLDFKLAGLTFALASFWDAICDPLIGHLSDNTRSRWGRRHPYILIGGIFMAIFFFCLWVVPGFVVKGGYLFTYLLAVNILFRTAFAFFSIPYGALGYDVVNGYHQRSQLQGLLTSFVMGCNLLGPALGWSLFFPTQPEGHPKAISMASNYFNMGITFTIASVILTLVVVFFTRRYARDNRTNFVGTGNSLRAFWRDSGEIIVDKYMRLIIIFFCIGQTGAIFVATLQMYLYQYFLELKAYQQTIIHGGGMVLCALGAVAGAMLARMFDKKYAVCIGAGIACFFDGLALLLYLGKFGIVTAGARAGLCDPHWVFVYGACDMLNWFGCGCFGALAGSMLADVAEVDELKSGIRKNAGFSAIFAFTTKLIFSISTFIASTCLAWVGFNKGTDVQTQESIRWLFILTFGGGSLFTFLVIPIALRYPISRAFMARVKKQLAEMKSIRKKTPEVEEIAENAG